MLDFKDDMYRQFIFMRTYSRWRDDLGRRETWEEAVQRYMDFMKERLGSLLTKKEYSEVQEAITNQEVMPSMRLFWSAGDACRKTNATAFNCTFTNITKPKDFGEILYLLTCGSGVGFSVESLQIDKLPIIKKQEGTRHEPFVVPDSREGWADALVKGVTVWFNGEDITFDYSKIRPLGSRLKTMGGRASGAQPLIDLLQLTRQLMLSRQGRKLRPIDVHDIVTKIGEVVVAGGTRRSAQISLSDQDDEDLRHAKVGQFWEFAPHRAMANNSAIYEEKPTAVTFMREWLALIESGTGERGIFNRGSVASQMPSRREYRGDMGTNPCGEIVLRSKQMCNLTEVIARAEDTQKSLEKKMRVATILGTYQSMLTDFGYLSKEWKDNCDEERLLGVSVTGQMDCPIFRDNPHVMRNLKDLAIKTNEEYSKRFKINPSTSVSAVKPSGTVSQLTNTSSGLHPRFSRYYIRRVRISSSDPLFHLLSDNGIVHLPEVGQTPETAHTFVLEFPVASPEDSIFDQTALEQLEYWKDVKLNYTEHNPSCTIHIADEEWVAVGDWVYKNWDIVGGLSFLPKDNHVYQLAPYEKIDKKTYDRLKKNLPEIDFSKLSEYEKEDNTIGSKEVACSSGTCELV